MLWGGEHVSNVHMSPLDCHGPYHSHTFFLTPFRIFVSSRVYPPCMQNYEQREKYELDLGTARKAVSALEARLETERRVGQVLETRLAAATAEAMMAQEQLQELEAVRQAVLETVALLN